MQKISSITATATSDGLFTNGSVATGVSPTILDAEWFNTIQNELVAVVQAGGLTLDPDNDSQVVTAIKALLKAQSAGRLINIQVFPNAGTYSYTPTPGTNLADAYVVGAGGGGGGTPATTTGQVSAGAGGGGGGTARSRFPISTLTLPVALTVGAGGSPGSVGVNPTGGGTSSFGTLLSATGGGAAANGTATPIGNTMLVSNGGGGTGVGGNFMNIKGGPGGRAIILQSGWESGEGGASTQSAGGDPMVAGFSSAGINGRLGAGGGGAFAVAGSGAMVGGKGADGVIMIMEYS